MISIVNYGLGNLGSIVNMLQYLNIPLQVIHQPEQLEAAEKLILPGVGAFDSGMENLKASGWIPVLEKKVLQQKTPVLGICLGMQLMTQASEEGVEKGLGWIDAQAVKINVPEGGRYRIPHMGWAYVTEHKTGIFDSGLLMESRFYFAHTYSVQLNKPEESLWLSAFYGTDFCAAFRHQNILGVQFHPEKSHKYGLDLLRKFYFEFSN